MSPNSHLVRSEPSHRHSLLPERESQSFEQLALLTPLCQSLFFQLLAVISFRALRPDGINFDVYKEEPVVA